ncbi:MAG: DUF1254 domain-containing protein [Deltaproteobacteria bacterium]|nr:DUF1254 domain-containing protein [Deltaproteobacteria bacterium]
MKGALPYLAAALVASVLVHLCTVMAVPYAVMLLLKVDTEAEPNRVHHGPLVTAETRDVVRPSPDLLYSACPFDLSDGPLQVTARVPDSYFSISAFADDTDNFFVLNDQQIETVNVAIVLVTKDQDYTAKPAERVVIAPSVEGVVIFRMLIEDRNALDEVFEIQRQADCRPVHR